MGMVFDRQGIVFRKGNIECGFSVWNFVITCFWTSFGVWTVGVWRFAANEEVTRRDAKRLSLSGRDLYWPNLRVRIIWIGIFGSTYSIAPWLLWDVLILEWITTLWHKIVYFPTRNFQSINLTKTSDFPPFHSLVCTQSSQYSGWHRRHLDPSSDLIYPNFRCALTKPVCGVIFIWVLLFFRNFP